MPNLTGLIPDKLVMPLVILLAAAVIVLAISGMGAADTAHQLCDQLKQAGAQVCQIDPAQLVQTDNGSAYLVVGKKVFQLQ